ncbi:hypothetical protein [Shewanella psychrotolerans]|uniref:hypothetical protein n=1 Tax=Shewanella psychrotolerans TaxID=2864206 RepID=UPI001C65C824|nr:hypothetical protein [Shewanella psychrotolerans]QYK01043.1 hypothetical protein K0I62_16935 [Shewanella psychrotolerans]
MDRSHENICIRPYKTLGHFVIALTIILVGINFFIEQRESFAEYLLFSGYCIAMIYWAVAINTQKIVFSATSVNFIKMSVESDFTLPRDLQLNYDEINAVRLLGDHLFIHGTRGKVSFPLKPQSKTTIALQSAFEAHGIPFEINSSLVMHKP